MNIIILSEIEKTKKTFPLVLKEIRKHAMGIANTHQSVFTFHRSYKKLLTHLTQK